MILPSFVDELKQDDEVKKNIILFYEYLIIEGLTPSQINNLPLWLFLRMMRDFKKLLKLKGVVVEK